MKRHPNRAGRLAPAARAPLASDADSAGRRSRVRLGLDLHDGPLQDLAAIGFSLGMLRRDIEALPGEARNAASRLTEVVDQLRAVESSLRSVISDETPVEPVGIVGLIEREVERFRRLAHADIEFECIGDVEPETESQKIALHRITREALSNVMRHAHAGNVQIELEGAPDVLRLRITDDGVGFDPRAFEHRRGAGSIGLRGMRKRVDLLGGSLQVDSREGGPTVVTASLLRWRPATVGGQPRLRSLTIAASRPRVS